MDINEIIKEINDSLTGDLKTDINYLQQKVQEYKDNVEISNYISRCIYMILPEDQKEDYANNMFTKEEKIEVELQRAAVILSANDKEKIDIAYNLVTNVVEQIKDEFKAGDTFKYYSFDDYMQFALYCNIFQPTKEVRRANYKYDDIYKMLGYILIEKGEYDEAIEVLRKGMSFNPVSVRIMFELGEAYKLQKDWDKFYSVSKRALEFAMSKEDIARAYRNIGFYFTEKEMYNEAIALFLLSGEFVKSDVAVNELQYIASKSGLNVSEFEMDKLNEVLEDNEMQLGVNPFILQLAYDIGQQALKDGKKDIAKYYFEFIFKFNQDAHIKEILEQLN